MKKKIILASGSPRRKLLLQQLGLDYISSPANISEDLLFSASPSEMVQNIAYRKARKVSEQEAGGIIIGADTVVYCGGMVMGKPANREEACAMLSKLSGQEHEVITGLCVLNAENYEYDLAAETTRVIFRPLTSTEISCYLDWEEWQDKAGAYGIQARGALLVDHIEGCFYNVVGLPLNRLNLMLRKHGIDMLGKSDNAL